MNVYVVGGAHKKDAWRQPRWAKYDRAVVLKTNLSTGRSSIVFEYVSPPELMPDDLPSPVFKSSSIDRGAIYLCTQTEVLRCELPTFRQVAHISSPIFNDVHHVLPLRDKLMVVSTGLDLVAELDYESRVHNLWHALGRNPSECYSADIDYRKVPTTKPHASHPNFVFTYNDQLWITRFEQKDAVTLTQPSRRIDIGLERPHDGHVRGNTVYFTTVNGHVVGFDLDTCNRSFHMDLNQFNASRKSLGWCRSICFIDDENILVGFTRLRKTALHQNLQWVKRSIGKVAGSLPTRVAHYNIKDMTLVTEYEIEDEGIHAVFSILPADIEESPSRSAV